jgi:hypothetical protein
MTVIEQARVAEVNAPGIWSPIGAAGGFERHATEANLSLKTETRSGLPAGYPVRVSSNFCRSMAVEVGFEPTDELPHHTLSRRAPSATRRLHRSRAYLSRTLRRARVG